MKWTGRPPKFQDAEEVTNIIEAYFKECENGNKPYTVTGLALTLGISLKSLRDYKNCVDDITILKQLDLDVKQDLSNIVKRAYQVCENYAEERLLDTKCNKSPVGYIFALKQFDRDFVDKQENIIENKTIEVSLEE